MSDVSNFEEAFGDAIRELKIIKFIPLFRTLAKIIWVRSRDASRAQALAECKQEIDNLKSEIACYEKYGLPHNPDGN